MLGAGIEHCVAGPRPECPNLPLGYASRSGRLFSDRMLVREAREKTISNERTGNVYENKGSHSNSPEQSGNVYEKKRVTAPQPKCPNLSFGSANKSGRLISDRMLVREAREKTILNERSGNVYENKGTLWKNRESPAEPESGPTGGASCTEGVKKSKQLIPRSGTKSRRNAKWKSFLSFATFAYFASLRETGLSIWINSQVHGEWEPVVNKSSQKRTNEAGMSMKTKERCRKHYCKARMCMKIQDLTAASGNVIENAGT